MRSRVDAGMAAGVTRIAVSRVMVTGSAHSRMLTAHRAHSSSALPDSPCVAGACGVTDSHSAIVADPPPELRTKSAGIAPPHRQPERDVLIRLRGQRSCRPQVCFIMNERDLAVHRELGREC